VQAPTASVLFLALLLPLLAWRVYSRHKRMVGRQRLSKYRPWVQLTIFPLLVLLFAQAARQHPERLAWLALALVAGAMLGRFGLRRTTFEPTPQGLFYTPNAHVGVALSALFVLRIAYRLVEVYVLHPGVKHGLPDFASSQLTLGVFGLLAGYYISYAIGLARWRQRVLEAKRRREQRSGDA
jgi:hypothetical protein